MAPYQHLTSCGLVAVLLLLPFLAHGFEEADLIKDQDFPLGGVNSRQLLQSVNGICPAFTQTPCPSGIAQCFPTYLGCDGLNDCLDGSDEDPAFCSTFKCDSQHPKCPSGKCTATIPYPPPALGPNRQYLCDGVMDCRDNSDEDPAFCANFDCAAAGSVTCPGPKKQCIARISQNSTAYVSGTLLTLCDGIKDCHDGSDEDPTFCANYSCEFGAFKCRNNQCILRGKVCNGVVDCPDGGSDEDRNLCGPGYDCSPVGVHCPSGYGCYSQGVNKDNLAICNGIADCLDQSDEDPKVCDASPCRSGYQRCPSGTGCFPNYGLCNGRIECLDKSDERADVCANVTCQSPTFNKCPSGQGGCLPDSSLCDGVQNCIDGSDELETFCRTYNCSSGYGGRVKCPSGVGCVLPTVLCDGIPGNGLPGCNDEDPAFCAGYTCSSPYTLHCRNGVCVKGRICDGTNDCADNSDEDPSFCQANQCLQGTRKCADNIHCVANGAYCDGKVDCPDKSDEDPTYCKTFQCIDSQTKCPGGTQCIYNFNNLAFCNGLIECMDRSDEDPAFCASYQCTQGRFKCPGTNVCVTGQLCNGIRDCPDNSDESDAVCGPGASSSPTETPASTTGAPASTTSAPSITPAATTVAPSPTTPPPSDTPASTTGAPAPTGTTPSSTPPATTEGPSPTTCDSATPNRCFNEPGNASICCPGQCPGVPTDPPTCGPPGFSPIPPGGACDPTSSLPNKCSNADGSQSVCCPGDCPYAPGPTATCA